MNAHIERINAFLSLDLNIIHEPASQTESIPKKKSTIASGFCLSSEANEKDKT